MSIMRTGSLIVLLLVGHCLVYSNLNKQRTVYIEKDYIDITLPSSFTGPMSLEFKGITSDVLLFKFMTFIGSRTDQIGNFDEKHWAHIKKSLHCVTDLDPYFWDAYLFSEMFLGIQAGRVADANELLQKGRENLPEEWRIPYYIGFNYYYFQKDFESAAKYFMEASKLPGSRPYLANLAARLTVFSNKHQLGIIFLEEMIAETNDLKMKASLEKRLTALKMLAWLNEKIKIYKGKEKELPKTLNDLLRIGIVKELPQDPYGGQFYLLPNGQVYTTSKLL